MDSNVNDWPKIQCERQVKVFDDGHIPENLLSRLADDDDEDAARPAASPVTQLVTYPAYHSNRPATVNVFDNACEDLELVNDLYNMTCKNPIPWGTYVTMQHVRDHWKNNIGEREKQLPPSQDQVALKAVSCFLRNAMGRNSNKPVHMRRKAQSTNNRNENTDNSNSSTLWTESDMLQAHGCAVWALASDCKSSVPYHLDYAELVRYQTGVIVPPVLAGTLQCTPATIVEGGTYCVHMGGIDHYQQTGYKGSFSKKKQQHQQKNDRGNKCNNHHNVSKESPTANSNSNYSDDHAMALQQKADPDWFLIPYKHNRMICQSGHLPHLSTTVKSIGESLQDCYDKNANSSQTYRRVIVGFNVFLKDIGPVVQRAPERKFSCQDSYNHHTTFLLETTTKVLCFLQCEIDSYAFRRTVGLQRWITKKETQKKPMSLKEVQQNPAMARLLVLAKRQRIKENFAKAQKELQSNVWELLKSKRQRFAVRDLMEQFGGKENSDGLCWPSATDVQVFISQKCKEGKLIIVHHPCGATSSDKRDFTLSLNDFVCLPSESS